MIERTRDLAVCELSYATILSSSVTTGLVEMEIKLFLSCDLVINRLYEFVDDILLSEDNSLPSLITIGLTRMEIYRFYLSRVHTLTHQLAKYGGHRTCRSRDII